MRTDEEEISIIEEALGRPMRATEKLLFWLGKLEKHLFEVEDENYYFIHRSKSDEGQIDEEEVYDQW